VKKESVNRLEEAGTSLRLGVSGGEARGICGRIERNSRAAISALRGELRCWADCHRRGGGLARVELYHAKQRFHATWLTERVFAF